MASPTPRSVAITNGTGATAAPVVNLPATVRAGDTLWVVIRQATAGAIGWPDATWNEVVDASPDAGAGQTGFAWKKADGSESGTTITLSSGNGKFAAVAWAVQDAADPTLRAPEISTVAVGTTPTQPNATTVTPTGGSKDYLFLTFVSMEGEATGITSYPTNYTLGQSGFANSGTAAATTTNGIVVGAARQATAASEDAGAWTIAGTLAPWSAYTAAFHPATPVTEGLEEGRSQTATVLPLPRKRAASMAVLTIAVNLLQTTLDPFPPKPFNQNAWPTPPAKAQLLVSSSSRPQEDANTPASQSDWPNPLRAKAPHVGFTYGPNPDSITTTPVVAAPFAQTDWPRHAPVRPLVQTWTQSGRLDVLAATPVLPIAWPNPTLRPASALPPSVQPNPLAATLTSQPGVGASATDLPRPRPQPALTWTQERKSYYQDIQPTPTLDWPVPQVKRPPTLTWIGGTLAIGEPVRPIDWTNPRQKPPAPPASSPPSLLAGTLTSQPGVGASSTDVPAPARTLALTWLQARPQFYQDIQPQPTADLALPVTRRAQTLTWTSSTLALGDPLRPVDQSILRRPSAFQQTDVPNLLTSTLAVVEGTPITPLAWTVPARAAQPTLTWIQERKQFYSDIQPAFSADLTLPARRASVQPFAPQNLLLTTLATQAGSPTQPIDWPLPRRSIAAWQPTTGQNLLLSTLAGAPLTPVAWPNPELRKTSALSWTHSSQRFYEAVPPGAAALGLPAARARVSQPDLRSPLLSVLVEPLRPVAWPVPSAVARAVPEVSTPSLLATLLAENPLAPIEWTVPPSPVRPPSTWLQERKTYYEDIQPFGPFEWPVPPPVRRPHQDGAWTQRALSPLLVPGVEQPPALTLIDVDVTDATLDDANITSGRLAAVAIAMTEPSALQDVALRTATFEDVSITPTSGLTDVEIA